MEEDSLQINREYPGGCKLSSAGLLYLIASWIIHQLVAAGVQGLPSVHRVEDHLIADHHLQIITQNNNTPQACTSTTQRARLQIGTICTLPLSLSLSLSLSLLVVIAELPSQGMGSLNEMPRPVYLPLRKLYLHYSLFGSPYQQ